MVSGIDNPLLLLIGLAVVGVLSKNDSVTIAVLVLALLRITQLNKAFPLLEKTALQLESSS